MWANAISLVRMLLGLVLCWALTVYGVGLYVPAFWLTLLIIWMDGWDGYVARRFNQQSTLGAVLDILCDRVVEQAYWIVFAVLGWVPVWMVLVIITRGVLVDGLRSLGLAKGQTAFGSNTIMQHPVGVLLTSSRFSRWTYAVVKAAMFAVLIVAHDPHWSWCLPLADATVWATLIFCLLRGLPVLWEVKRFV
jgi:CDP-diacylglycerol---glycerol-3-phosphate 3-phosphatidyltransferase